MAVIAGTATASVLPLMILQNNIPSVIISSKSLGGKTSSKFMGVKASFDSPFKTGGGGGGGGGGAGVLERPKFDQSQFEPAVKVLEGGDIGRVRDNKGTGSGDSYRVLLVDDTRHSEKLVAKVLPQVVPSVTADNARELFHVSRENGVAVVIVTVKEHAEFYSQMMVRGGLRSAIEPDSNLV